MTRRKNLQELNLLDKFLFDEATEDQEFLETVLSIILDRRVVLKESPETEKEQRRTTDKRKIQLDVWSKDIQETIYDTEVQKENTGNLPRRFRLYHALIDSSLLPTGVKNFNLLNDVVVIIIAPFDLFGQGRYRYTFRMRCDEFPELSLDDGAATIFLNTQGTEKGDVSDELVELLRYFEDTSDHIAGKSTSERVKALHRKIQQIREDEKVGIKYMNRWEEDMMHEEIGQKRGEEIGQRRMQQLCSALEKDGRTEQFLAAMSDTDLLYRLYEEYNIS